MNDKKLDHSPDGLVSATPLKIEPDMRAVCEALVRLDELHASFSVDDQPTRPDWLRHALRAARANLAGIRYSVPAAIPATPPAVMPAAPSDAAEARYRFLLGFLIERGVLTNDRYSDGTWCLRGIYGVDDSGLRGAGRTAEEAIDNAIVAANLDPATARMFWQTTHAAIYQTMQPQAEPAAGEQAGAVAARAWINYPVKVVNGEFAGYGEPELSFKRLSYGYDCDKAEALYLAAPGAAIAAREQEAPSDDEQLVATLIHCSREVSPTAMIGYDLASVLSRAAERIQFLTQPTTVQQAK